jgi:hypothetical protein
VRAAALVLALLVLPALLPGAAAQGSRVWSAASELSLVDGEKVVETRHVTFDGRYYNPTWTVTIPPGATFREARDASGALSGTVSAGKVTVPTRGQGVASYTFTVVFDLKPRAEGPFLSFNATVPGDVDSPTSVKLVLPPDWSLEGWFGWSGSSPDASGVFRRTGGQVVEFLVLAPDAPRPAPARPVVGHGVLREGVASLTATGGRLNLTVTYDTDVYGASWQLPLPEGASLVAASTPYGPMPATVAGGMVSFQTPYKARHHLGARAFSLEFALPAPDSFGGPYRGANLSIAAVEGDNVTLRVALDPALTRVGETVGGGARVGALRYEGDGPLRARVAFLPPVPADSVRFTAGAYVVQAPRALEAAARATAANASDLLPSALGFLGGADVERPFFVAYTDADVFAWEEGFYTHGLDAISIRASELRDAPQDGKAHLVPVATLVHETAHGLLDRAFLDSPDDLSFLHEGVSRLAETHVERHFPNEVVACATSDTPTGSRTSCQRQSARPEPDRAQSFLASVSNGASFDVAWGADTASADARGFLYDWSGLVFHAYERAAGPDALRFAVAEMAAAGFTDDPDKDAETVVSILLSWAPGLTSEQLMYPGAQVSKLGAGQFRACMGDLLPPYYPFEAKENAPATGCGWPTVGTRDAPAPTTNVSPTPTPAPASPVVQPPTRVNTDPIPTPDLLGEPPTGDGGEDGSPIERTGSPTPQPGESAPTPGPSVLVVLMAATVAGLTWRRRD